MINILIIEDNLEKLRAINKILVDICAVPEGCIDAASNIKDGRECLMKKQYDLLLLDLVLPINDESPPTTEAGTNFLDEIYYNSNINIPIHIIGLTEFDEVFDTYVDHFDDKLWGLINFSLKETDWQDKLKSKVLYLQNFKKKFTESIVTSNKYDIAIVTALTSEFEQLLKATEWRKHDSDDQVVFYESTMNTKNSNNIKIVACCINHMGMHSASAISSKVISLFNPKLLFIVGICAGIESETNMGDIIVAKQMWDYESGKVSEDETGNLIFKPDIQSIPTHNNVLSKISDFAIEKKYISEIYDSFEGEKPDTQLKVHFGPVGSGPYVLSSKKYLDGLMKSDRKLIGIDMEGFGIYRAAEFHVGTIPVFVKAVSDHANNSKNDKYHKYASYTSANFVIKYIYNVM